MNRARLDIALPWAAAAIVGALVAGAAAPRVPPFFPIVDGMAYGTATPAALTLLEPVAHAPWLGAPAFAVCAVLAAVVAMAFWVTGRWLGASASATLIALAAFVVRPDVRDLLATGAPALAAVACLWGAMVAEGRAAAVPGSRRWSAVLVAGATALWPPAIVLAPLLAAAQSGPARAGVLLAAAGAGAVVGVARWAALAGAIGGERVTLASAWPVVAGLYPHGASASVWPPLAAAAAPVVCMGAGLAALAVRVRPRFWHGVAIVGALIAVSLTPLAWRAELARALYWTAWPAAALGLEWLAAATGRGRLVVLTLGGALIIGAGVVPPVARGEEAVRRAFADVFADVVPAPDRGIVLVAEDPRVDAALVAYRAAALSRVRPVPDLVAARLAAGAAVWAGPGARAALELWGFRFSTRETLSAPAPFTFSALTGRFRCVPIATSWRELPGLEYTGRLGVHVPAGQGRFETVIVGAPPGRPSMTSPRGQSRGRVESLAMDRRVLPPVLWPDGGVAPDPALQATKLTLDAQDAAPSTVAIALGSRAPLVAVRFVDDARSTGVATVCAAALPRDDELVDSASWRLPLADPTYFAGGWHGVERVGDRHFRWTTGRALLLVPSAGARAITLSVDAEPAVTDEAAPTTIAAIVNGWPAGAHPMAGAGRYTWPIPNTLWVDGTNEIQFDVSRTGRPPAAGGANSREHGARVTEIRLATVP